MSQKPTLIFTPGAWHTPEPFYEVNSQLSAHGYKCIVLPLHAVGGPPGPAVPNLDPDIAAIRAAVFSEIEEGNDVVMVAHSWGGLVVSGATAGLGKAERAEKGQNGGIVKLAYVSAFVPPENVSLIAAFGGTPPEWYNVEEPWVTVRNPTDVFYHDLPPEKAKHWASKLLPHSYPTKFVGYKTAGWRTIPSVYLLCEDDHAIPIQVQESLVEACRESGAKMETKRLFCSHSPFLARPDEFVEFVRRAAGEEVLP